MDVEVGLKGGFATSPLSSGPNPVGGGLGARAGVAFLGGFYVGGSVVNYFFGSTTSSTASYSTTSFMLGGEAGYGFTVRSRLILRPQVGLGLALVGTTASGGAAAVEDKSTGEGYVYVEPGVTALVMLGLVFVGADATFVLFFPEQQSHAAFTMHGQVGVRF
ncbi:MAG TPA: autotransporter outer membrane beta-barrel domain-containing protein [Polyangiaceae bacterium]